MAYFRILIILIGVSVSGIKIDPFQCSNEQLQRCLISVTFDRSTIDVSMSTVDSMRHCRSIRDGMNCLVWFSLNCINPSERLVTKNLIENVRQYIRDVCEDFEQVDENWLDRNCFLTNEMEKCKDNYFKNNGYNVIDEFSCGQYYFFKTCVEQTLNEKCEKRHESYLTTYLFDKAGQHSLVCSKEPMYFNNRNDQEMLRSIKGAQCLINYRNKLGDCRRIYDEKDIKLIESDDIFASACCAFNRYSSCIKDTVGENCRSESIELTDMALSRINRDLYSKCATFRHDMCSSCSSLSSFIVLIIVMITVNEVWKNM